MEQLRVVRGFKMINGLQNNSYKINRKRHGKAYSGKIMNYLISSLKSKSRKALNECLDMVHSYQHMNHSKVL